MYTRYIPQPDGSYQRNHMPDQPARNRPQQDQHKPPQASPTPPTPQPSCQTTTGKHFDPIWGFFKNLLPQNMDTGDLIVILLLLLMANDCEENRNHALLTLALYFFL